MIQQECLLIKFSDVIRMDLGLVTTEELPKQKQQYDESGPRFHPSIRTSFIKSRLYSTDVQHVWHQKLL